MIPTAFVIVSFSRSAMTKLFSTGATFKDLLKEAETNDDVFLFNNAGNANFINLEHVGGKNPSLKLEVIDPQQEFEKRLITKNVTDLAGGYSSNINKTEKSPISFSDVEEYKEAVKENKQFFKEYTQELIKKEGKFQLYVAYGVGENLASWAGPHITDISNIDIDLKGSRKFTLNLTVNGSRINYEDRASLTRSDIDLSLEGLKSKIIAHSSPLDYFSFADSTINGTPRNRKIYEPYLGTGTYKANIEDFQKKFFAKQSEQISAALLQGGPAAAAQAYLVMDLLKEIDIHLIITECIKRYIQTATGNSNVIVLLPDLNVLLKKFIQTKIIQSANDTNLVGPDAEAKGVKNPINALIQLTKSTSNLLEIYDQTRSIFSSLGMRVKAKFKDNRASVNPNLETERERNYDSVESRAIAFFKKRNFYVSIDSKFKKSFKSVDSQAVITEIMEKIQQATKSEAYGSWKNVTYFETDGKFLELWGREKSNPVFSTDHHSFDPDKPAIIYGDAQMIKELLYAEYIGKVEYSGPIHPIHQFSLGPGYRKRAKAITDARLDASIAGPFGETTFVPDEFAYLDDNLAASKALRKLVKENRISVFRYNVQNPNVIDMKLTFSPIYFSLLKGMFIKEVEKRAVASVEGVVDSKYSLFDLPTPDAVIAYIRQRHNSLGDSEEAKKQILEELSSKDISSSFGSDSAEESAKLAYAKYQELLELPEQPMVLVDQQLPGNPVSIVADMSEQLYRKAITLTIQTLPAFYHSGIVTMRTPILLLASDRPIKQTSPPDQSLLDTFYSGLYLINGFKHSISSGKASSEFHLQRMAIEARSKDKAKEDEMELPTEEQA
jgi:hypothetical protein